MALKNGGPMVQTCTQWDLPSPQVDHASPGALSRPGEGNRAHRISRGVRVIFQRVVLVSERGCLPSGQLLDWALSSGPVYLGYFEDTPYSISGDAIDRAGPARFPL